MTGGKAGKAAASQVTGIKRKKNKKKVRRRRSAAGAWGAWAPGSRAFAAAGGGRAKATAASVPEVSRTCALRAVLPQGKDKEGGGGKEGGGEMFSGDGLPSKPGGGGTSKVYAGGARSGKVKVRCCWRWVAGAGAGRERGLRRVCSCSCAPRLSWASLPPAHPHPPLAGAAQGVAEQDGAEQGEARRQGQARVQVKGQAPAALGRRRRDAAAAPRPRAVASPGRRRPEPWAGRESRSRVLCGILRSCEILLASQPVRKGRVCCEAWRPGPFGGAGGMGNSWRRRWSGSYRCPSGALWRCPVQPRVAAGPCKRRCSPCPVKRAASGKRSDLSTLVATAPQLVGTLQLVSRAQAAVSGV